MDNQEKTNQSSQNLKMIDLRKPATNDGVGVFFAVARLAIANTSWPRKDFNAVQLVEGQLDYLEKYCNQEFGTEDPQEKAPEKEPEAQGEEKASEDHTISEPIEPKDKREEPAEKEEESQKKNSIT